MNDLSHLTILMDQSTTRPGPDDGRHFLAPCPDPDRQPVPAPQSESVQQLQQELEAERNLRIARETDIARMYQRIRDLEQQQQISLEQAWQDTQRWRESIAPFTPAARRDRELVTEQRQNSSTADAHLQFLEPRPTGEVPDQNEHEFLAARPG